MAPAATCDHVVCTPTCEGVGIKFPSQAEADRPHALSKGFEWIERPASRFGRKVAQAANATALGGCIALPQITSTDWRGLGTDDGDQRMIILEIDPIDVLRHAAFVELGGIGEIGAARIAAIEDLARL